MKHDLEAINAALLLGDRPVPPRGAEIHLKGSDLDCTVTSLPNDTTLQIRLCSDGALGGIGFHALFLCGGYTVTGLPENVPPFCEWDRSWRPARIK